MNFSRIPFLFIGLVLLIGAAGAFNCYESSTAPDGICCMWVYKFSY